MLTSHALLLRLFHDPQYRFGEVTVCYVDRGAPGDRTCVRGEQIAHLDSYYMEISSPYGPTAIPYHRIRKILYEEGILWEWTQSIPAPTREKEGR
ncbi:MAG: DUF504 domain-containing protein [Methanomicrobiales archaeon]|nr:DUF504 domain-containing protein [Methanomicrobiales archaeon]